LENADSIHSGTVSFFKEYQSMTFNQNGISVVVGFELFVDGYVTNDEGDYLTAPASDIEISEVDINIVYLEVDEYEVELNSELIDIVKKLINKNI
jgi:hypothetical protein